MTTYTSISKEELPEGWYYAPPRNERGLTREQFDKALMSGKKTVYNDNFHCWKEKSHSDYLDKTWLFAYECGSECCHGEFKSLDEAWEFMAGDSPEMLYVIPPEFPSITTAESSNKYVSGDPRQTINGQKEPN